MQLQNCAVELIEDLLNLLLPSNCVICARVGSNLCENCRVEIKLNTRKVSRLGISGFSTTEYTPEIAKIIHEFKEANQTSFAKLMATAMQPALASYNLENVMLVPMPSKKKSFAKRGFEPATLLARSLARRVAKECNLLLPVPKLLYYQTAVQDQAALSGEDRRTNLIGSMTAETQSKATLSRAILVDDVVTTGATLTEAKRCLEGIGVEVIGFVTFAETLPKNLQNHPKKSV